MPTAVSDGRTVSLHAKYEPAPGPVLLSGIEALVRLVLEQRWLDRRRHLATAAFVSGYEGSPLGGFDLALARAAGDLDAAGVVFRPGLNEELAATAVAGTQLVERLPGRRHDGVVGFWYGKNPGLDRAADAIRHATMAGTAPLGGVVALVGDDPTSKSSTLPSSCETMAASLGVPLLAPSSIPGLVELGLHAVALSRHAGTWAALKVVADLADGSATATLPLTVTVPHPDRDRPFPARLLVGPPAVEAEEDLVGERLPRAAAYAATHGLNAVRSDAPGARVAVVASGLAYAAVVRACAELGLDGAARRHLGLRLVELAVPWPLDHDHIRRLLAGVEDVLVVEDKASFVESQVKDALYRTPAAPRVLGKRGADGRPLVPAHGAVDADVVARVLGEVLGAGRLPAAGRDRLAELARPAPVAVVTAERVPALPTRSPAFCSGCPHNLSTRAADGQLVGLGIGCHIMAGLDPVGRGHQVGMTQMGGEGAQWIGMAPFTDDRHYAQNLGDGTFFHSGSLAVRAAVAAGSTITFKLLFNDAVAMTGGQAPEGRMAIPELTRWLAAEGVRRVVVTTPEPERYRGVALDPVAEVRHRDDLPAVNAELAATAGVTVLIHDDRCAAEERRLRGRGTLPAPTRRVWINERVCEGCGDCGEKSTCLSVRPVDTEFGRRTRIHQGSCNVDYSCLQGDCPSFVTVEQRPPRRRRRRRAARPAEEATGRPRPPDVPDPSPAGHGALVVRMAGIGGTGVVTVSRVLQMAALLSGLEAAGVDQTGLSQKGGPVVSDVRLAPTPVEGQVRAGRASADVLLAFDAVAAAAEGTLAAGRPGHTSVVANGDVEPTAGMVRAVGAALPAMADLERRLTSRGRPGAVTVVPAGEVAEHLVGEHHAVNVVVVGAAYQLGLLPVGAEALEAAIRLNGAAVEANLTAFRWGRAAVADPGAVRGALSPAVPVTLGATRRAHGRPAPAPTGPGEAAATAEAERLATEVGWSTALRDLVAGRAADLVAYQGPRYARRYLGWVAEVADTERRRAADPAWPVTTAYARQLYKLMAYKDEYEVARLHLLPEERARLRLEVGDGRARVLLQPPLLKALGLRRKIALGRSAVPAFTVLRAGRRLRGSPFDPFGHTDGRRLDRALVGEYRSLVDSALARLGPDSAATVAAVASLPELIRGYEDVRRAGVERFRREASVLLSELAGASPAPASRLPVAG